MLTGPHCADWPLNSEKKPEEFAAHALGLHGDAVELGLLLGLGFLVAADLVFARGVATAAATIERDELAFQPHAHRIWSASPFWPG